MKNPSPVLTAIREMILQGRLAPGERVPEADLAAMLGVSRTPIRQALPVLAEEGLLVEAGARGFSVRAFTIDEIVEAVDVRGALEGMAARALAERGAPRSLVRAFRELLDDGDAIFAKRFLVEADEETYGDMNARFHELIIEASRLRMVRDMIERVNRTPFASPRTIAFDKLNLLEMFDALHFAHRQHHQIAQAIEAGESARAESLLREHVNIQKYSMNLRRIPVAPGARATSEP